jgi:hypothetical protein
MTRQQNGVMWAGLLLIVLRLFTTVQWDTLKAAFQTVTPGTSTAQSAGSNIGLPGVTVLSAPITPPKAPVHPTRAPMPRKPPRAIGGV